MNSAVPVSPDRFWFDSLDSTNDEAARRVKAGAHAPFWIAAHAQTRGRGRQGRMWQSPPGNLYATVALELAVSPATATGLSFVAALALRDALSQTLIEAISSRIQLKWPNDLYLDDAKLGGILLESAARTKNTLLVLAGMGVNLAVAPSAMQRKVACLHLKPAYAKDVAFPALINTFQNRLTEWDHGAGFSLTRNGWLKHAYGLGGPVTAKTNGCITTGVFHGIGDDGALLIRSSSGGAIQSVSSGETVFGGTEAA
jgi:BirA family biotin operon repressor/biotin-[acetyl-CoA-carboxylase] ligase